MAASWQNVEWVAVSSSNVVRVGYERDFSRLWVWFGAKPGAQQRIYHYDGVEEHVYQSLLAAPSKGQFVYHAIRAAGTDSRYAVYGPYSP